MLWIDTINNYLDIARNEAKNSTCLRRSYGAIIVAKNEVISYGSNDVPTGCESCIHRGTCKRKDLKVPHGERYEMCRSVHAEQNAILNADRDLIKGSTMFIYGYDKQGYLVDAYPCKICAKLILQSGIYRVVIKTKNNHFKILYHDDLKKLI